MDVGRQLCGCCHKWGHNKRTCEVRKGQAQVATYFSEGRKEELKSILVQLETEGWRILAIGKRDMKTLVSLVDLTNPELVRTFLFFAPNDDTGVMGKTRIYAKIFRSREGRAPSISRDAEFFLQCGNQQRSYEDLANMAYALIWYTHYYALMQRDRSVFASMRQTFEEKREDSRRCRGPYNIAQQLLLAPLDEGIHMFEASETICVVIVRGSSVSSTPCTALTGVYTFHSRL